MQALNDRALPLMVKLHGDFHSRALKNTSAELREQDARLRREGKGIPSPLADPPIRGSWRMGRNGASGTRLTKMNWNNDGLYDRLPVPLPFASKLADIVKRMPRIEPRAYQVRLFM
jgi:hypothetical protein